ncbi:unnamed protein product, partial [Schistosoma margrebowiei]
SWDNDLEDLANRQVVACNLSSEYKKVEVEKEYRDKIGINTADNLNVLNRALINIYSYTKIVWGSAEFIGCSTGYCNDQTEVKSGKIIVCYYSPMTAIGQSLVGICASCADCFDEALSQKLFKQRWIVANSEIRFDTRFVLFETS